LGVAVRGRRFRRYKTAAMAVGLILIHTLEFFGFTVTDGRLETQARIRDVVEPVQDNARYGRVPSGASTQSSRLSFACISVAPSPRS
jgi:hypothetical protein